jgi:hypothetical protein
MGFHSCLDSALPHYDWELWNVLEVLLRAWGICLSVSCMAISLMMSDSGTDSAMFLTYALMLDFFLLTVALVIRHWMLGVLTAYLAISFTVFVASSTCFLVLNILLAVECFFHPVQSMCSNVFEEQSSSFGADTGDGMGEYAPLGQDAQSAADQDALV